jgi:hypothetical protein
MFKLVCKKQLHEQKYYWKGDEWGKPCIDGGMQHQKLKIHVKTRFANKSDHIWGEVGIQASHEVVSWMV